MTYIVLADEKIKAIKRSMDEHKLLRRKKLFRKDEPTMECLTCHGRMKKSTGEAQIENKRENAPICVACILGKKRNPEKALHIKRVKDALVAGKKENKNPDNHITRRKILDELSNR